MSARLRDLAWLCVAGSLTCCAQIGGFHDFTASDGPAGSSAGGASGGGLAGTGNGGAGTGNGGAGAGGNAGHPATSGGNPSTGGQAVGGSSAGGAGTAGGGAGTAGGGAGTAGGGAAAGGNAGLLENCVLLMHFEETSWSTTAGAVKDSSGLGNHGAASVSTVVPAPGGKFGKAASFDGNGWIAVPDAASLHADTAVTLAAWVKAQGSVTVDFSPGIIAKRNGFADNVAYTLFLWNNDGSMTVPEFHAYSDVSSDRFFANTVIVEGSWVHVALVYDGGLGSAKIYINGALATTSDPAPASIPASTAELRIGDLANSGTLPFQGLIDEAVVWTRALSAAEIAQLYSLSGPL